MDCVKLMADGLWVTGVSNVAIAEKHGVSVATVKAWATNASRIIRALHEGDMEEIRARSLSTLETIVATAMRTKKAVQVYRRTKSGKQSMATEFMDEPSLSAAVAALELRAKLLGLIVQKHDVTTRPKVAHLSREEHLAELEKLEAEIAAEVKRIAAEGSTS
jgi:uncharacterized protein YjcR